MTHLRELWWWVLLGRASKSSCEVNRSPKWVEHGCHSLMGGLFADISSLSGRGHVYEGVSLMTLACQYEDAVNVSGWILRKVMNGIGKWARRLGVSLCLSQYFLLCKTGMYFSCSGIAHYLISQGKHRRLNTQFNSIVNLSIPYISFFRGCLLFLWFFLLCRSLSFHGYRGDSDHTPFSANRI